jgi:hypothetical protein
MEKARVTGRGNENGAGFRNSLRLSSRTIQYVPPASKVMNHPNPLKIGRQRKSSALWKTLLPTLLAGGSKIPGAGAFSAFHKADALTGMNLRGADPRLSLA